MGFSLPQTEKEYLTSDGDVVDLICWNFYGMTSNNTVEAVLDRNLPVLAHYGPILPAGILLILPVIVSPSATFQLWNYKPETVYQPIPTTPPPPDTLEKVEIDLENFRLTKAT